LLLLFLAFDAGRGHAELFGRRSALLHLVFRVLVPTVQRNVTRFTPATSARARWRRSQRITCSRGAA
jgi:hypothetical protein